MADTGVLKTLRDERSAIMRGIENTQANLRVLEDRLKAIDAAISNVEPFYETPIKSTFEISPLGLYSHGVTDAIRGVYQTAPPGRYLSPTEVRDALKAAGLLKGYDNEMAVIHQVIRRLQDQAQIETHPREKTHRWLEPKSVQAKPEPISRVGSRVPYRRPTSK